LCKYVNDAYVIIPASNEASRLAELDNAQRRAEQNNLGLNLRSFTETAGDGTLPKSQRRYLEQRAAAA